MRSLLHSRYCPPGAFLRIITALIVASVLSACSTLPRNDSASDIRIADVGQPPNSRPPSYIRLYDATHHPKLLQRVSANFSSGQMTLQNALVLALPFPVSLALLDDGVDLTRRVAVRAQNVTVREYLKQLAGLTDYQIRPNADVSVLEIASVVTRHWNLAALAGMGQFRTRLGFDSEGEGAIDSETDSGSRRSHTMSVRKEHEDTVWNDIVAHAHCVIQTTMCADGGRSSVGRGYPDASDDGQTFRPGAGGWVVDNRRMGTITATGSPQNIARLNKWLRNLSADSERLVHLECAILDILVNDEQAFGVELGALFRDGDFSANLSYDAGDTAGSQNGLLVGAGFNDRHFDLGALISNLSRAADVRIQNRVRLAVTNGATAYLNTGEVFSYISNVDTSVNEVGTTTAYSQSRLQVGLELAVTPRFLSSGDRILVEVTPILSALLRFDELGTGSARLKTPVIALRQMSSQAVTSGGRPIIVGGLESNKLMYEEKGVLVPDILNDVLSDRTDESESRQLLIIVTPWEIT